MDFEKIKTNEKLEQILLNFIDVLRINIVMVDSHGNPVLVPQTSSYGFHGASQWGVLQSLGTPGFISKFQIEGDFLKSTDIFGFQSFAIPIPVGESDDIGYIVIGPVILNKQLDQSHYQSIAQEMNLNYSTFLECLGEVRVVTFNTLKSILDLVFELSRYALRMKGAEERPAVVKNKPVQLNHLIFTNLLDLAMSLAQAECGSIMLLNNLTHELSVLAFKGMDLHKIQNIPVKLDDGIAGLAVQKKECFVILENSSNNRIRHLLKKPQLKCAVVLPIFKNNNEILGVMSISTHQEKSRLAMHPKVLLKSLVEITSAAFGSF